MVKKQYGLNGLCLYYRIIQEDGKTGEWLPCECPHQFQLVRERNDEGVWQYMKDPVTCSLTCPLFHGVREVLYYGSERFSIDLCSGNILIPKEDFFPDLYKDLGI